MNKHKQIFMSALVAVMVLVPAVSWAASGHIAGRILLQVEQNGEAWYVEPTQGTRIYMKNGDVAYAVMRDFGLGISNADLSKIPIGFDARMSGLDTDGDGLLDKLEQALYLDASDKDSDDDGYTDAEEVWNGFEPRGSGAVPLDWNMADRLAGRIVLQVEQNGEAWYINPENHRRYYMPDGEAAYQLMRYLGLGITDANLATVPASAYEAPDVSEEEWAEAIESFVNIIIPTLCDEGDWDCMIENVRAEKSVATILEVQTNFFGATSITNSYYHSIAAEDGGIFLTTTISHVLTNGEETVETDLSELPGGGEQVCIHRNYEALAQQLERWRNGQVRVDVSSEGDHYISSGDLNFAICAIPGGTLWIGDEAEYTQSDIDTLNEMVAEML